MKHKIMIITLSLLLGVITSNVAFACPDGQYEACAFGLCACVPNSGTVLKQTGKTLNPLPDTFNVLGAIITGDTNRLSQAVGGLIVKGTCPSCDVLAQNIMNDKDKAFMEQVLGRGWLLWVSGVDPVIILADAANSAAVKYSIKAPEPNPLQPPPPQARGKKTYVASPAACGVSSDKSKIVFGWVNPPILTDRATNTAFTFPNVDLVKDDLIMITSSKDCPKVPQGQQLVDSATISFEYSDISPTVSATTMKHFLVGSEKKM